MTVDIASVMLPAKLQHIYDHIQQNRSDLRTTLPFPEFTKLCHQLLSKSLQFNNQNLSIPETKHQTANDTQLLYCLHSTFRLTVKFTISHTIPSLIQSAYFPIFIYFISVVIRSIVPMEIIGIHYYQIAKMDHVILPIK